MREEPTAATRETQIASVSGHASGNTTRNPLIWVNRSPGGDRAIHRRPPSVLVALNLQAAGPRRRVLPMLAGGGPSSGRAAYYTTTRLLTTAAYARMKKGVYERVCVYSRQAITWKGQNDAHSICAGTSQTVDHPTLVSPASIPSCSRVICGRLETYTQGLLCSYVCTSIDVYTDGYVHVHVRV